MLVQDLEGSKTLMAWSSLKENLRQLGDTDTYVLWVMKQKMEKSMYSWLWGRLLTEAKKWQMFCVTTEIEAHWYRKTKLFNLFLEWLTLSWMVKQNILFFWTPKISD